MQGHAPHRDHNGNGMGGRLTTTGRTKRGAPGGGRPSKAYCGGLCKYAAQENADELSYCLHIMVRYELEKKLIGGALTVDQIPAEWKRLYKEYLGIDVPNDREGCLQDSHWSGGSFGYFPSYALGSAYGAQMKHVMEGEIGSIDELIAADRIDKITEWLREKIHRHASFHKPGELFRSVCGEFDPSYYTDYLQKKYTALYGLK